MLIVDAHEDLAWNALTFGRDPMRPLAETRALEAGTTTVEHNGTALIGWPEWLAGSVAVVFATLFAAPARSRIGAWEEVATYDDAAGAHRLYREQLAWYHHLVAAHPDNLTLVRTRADLATVLASWAAGGEARRVGLVVLMEGAEGVREPSEVGEWVARGVRLIGPAWTGTRYVGGTREPGPFTEAGRALLREMANHQVILDLSHLSIEAVDEAFDLYPGPVVATHANARALAPSTVVPERYLGDEAIRRLAARNGVVGIVLGNGFLRDGVTKDDPKESVTLEDVVRHVDYVCQLVGDAAHVGLGSDFEGGFGRERVPAEFDSVADLPRIGEALAARGYNDAQVAAILGGNWLRVLQKALPG